MLTLEQSSEIIDKEQLDSLHFSPVDVLSLPADRLWRQHEAERAATLGNGYHGKVDIYFQTADGSVKRVCTTVWAADAEFLTLKSGASIPLRSVLGFDFF
ncbi:hypothetical protein PK28_09150 [Hymenobacter sp. DG25B]|jgi:hypothetical protein|uniref:hypothetical protein n=1 Tax=Hymenobacter sp. DG25B TaxID=1385664 RepID=UPI000540F003|nr:hypothetical protein [Hymenobacter sp. DG25B]AIZ63816.1 hypothetical protein PK28_09150 [Hymenobacter sp. DG25B]